MCMTSKRVLIIGGAGTFGSRLAELLRRDGHRVWIAGRDGLRTQAAAEALGVQALTLDARGDLSALDGLDLDWIVDAAGPFQAYGSSRDTYGHKEKAYGRAADAYTPPTNAYTPSADTYSLPRACIARGIGYLDLADDAAFVAGIGCLDAEAKAAGVAVISGASSVPGLSSGAVAALAADLDRIDSIESAILPGNRAPRGRAVIAGILSHLGRRCPRPLDGTAVPTAFWSDPAVYTPEPGMRRVGRFIEVPDIRLFARHFGARSVMFRAGLELRIMNWSLSRLARLADRGLLPPARRLLGPLHWLSRLLEPYGSDRGAMQVYVSGLRDGAPVRLCWTLIAAAGEGPYVPTLLARTCLRRTGMAPGARACLTEVTLEEIDAAMTDLSITTHRADVTVQPLIRPALGAEWDALAPEIRRAHQLQDRMRLAGMARVVRGSGLLARLIAGIVGFPATAEHVPVEVIKQRRGETEIWQRSFGGRRFRSHFRRSPRAGEVFERFGPMRFALGLSVADGQLRISLRRAWLLGLPLPRILAPSTDSREHVEDGRFCFDVAIHAPLTRQTVVHYRGWLVQDDAPVTQSAHTHLTRTAAE